VKANRPKIYCFDLDGTLCTNTWGDYEAARPFPWAIERVNALARAGHVILIFTARGGTTGIDWRARTEAQLESWGVAYAELVFGKPQADVYVDDRTVGVDAWRYGDALAWPRRDPAGAAVAMPAATPPRATTVIEVGRTFGGEPFRLEEHARRAATLADRHGLLRRSSESDIQEAVWDAIGSSREALPGGEDLVFTIALGGPSRAAYIDTYDERLEPALTIGCRLVSQTAAGLPRYIRGGAVAASSAPTEPSGDTWPLFADATGALTDALGGDLVLADGGELRIAPQTEPSSVAITTTLQLASELGLRVQETVIGADGLAEGDELLIVDLPFCVLPVGVLDGRRLDRAPGPIAAMLASGWNRLTGSDPMTYWKG
jgi:branched-subunit amino acid aminotransferase/4-amino-4-deoxychorismate lyase